MSISNPWAPSASSMSFTPTDPKSFSCSPTRRAIVQVTRAQLCRRFLGLLVNLLRLLQNSLLLVFKCLEIPRVRFHGQSLGDQKIPSVTVRNFDRISSLAERLHILF